MVERDIEFENRVQEIRGRLAEMPLSQFTVSDLKAIMGIEGLIDGITSGFHPSEEDVSTLEDRLKSIDEAKKSDNIKS